MRRVLTVAFVALLVVSSVALAQGQPWELFRTPDGMLWIVADGVRHRIVPREAPAEALARLPEGEAWESGQIGGAPAAAAPPAPPAAPAPPAPAQDIVIGVAGFGQEGARLGYGFVVENRRPDVAYAKVEYQVAVYDGSGAVLKTDSHWVEHLAAGQRLGVGGDVILPEGTRALRIEVQALARQPTQDTRGVFLTGEGGTYRPGTYPKVTGMIRNTLGQAVTTVWVSALAYDGTGAIIGGGRSYLDFVPANGQAAAEVSVYTSGRPARVELHPVHTISGRFQ